MSYLSTIYKATANLNVYSVMAETQTYYKGMIEAGAIFRGNAQDQFTDGSKNYPGWVYIVEILYPTTGFAGVTAGQYTKVVNSSGTSLVEPQASIEVGNISNSISSSSESDEYSIKYVDDTFVEVYEPYLDSDTYKKNLDSGLRISDLRGIFGMPPQFLPVTDPRIDNNGDSGKNDAIDSFGRVYAEKIISDIPLLLMTPGLPSFMSGYSKSQKTTIIEKFLGSVSDDIVSTLINETSGKYYALKFSYTDYFYYVNDMLRSAAIFMGIEDEEIDGKKLSTYDWLYDNDTSAGSDSTYTHGKLRSFLGTYAGAIPFYADAGNTVDDSFSNNTTTSSLSSMINNLSSTGRELNFLLGNVGGIAGLKLDAWTSQENLLENIENTQDMINSLLPGSNVLSNIVTNAETLLAGGKMMFPELWDDSNFSRSYSIKMKFGATSGDPLDIYLNVLVPIYHILGFVWPRQSVGQSYQSPFLVRAYYKGLFNVDMGIITDLSLTKGAEGKWTKEGIPTVVEVSFNIKDMYDGIFMSTSQYGANMNIFSNTTELDYIANSCGINIDEPDLIRTIKMYLSLQIVGNVKDKISIGIFGNMSQWLNQKFQNIFGRF